jgi:hypothetical protein
MKVLTTFLLLSSAALFAQEKQPKAVSDTLSVDVNDSTSIAESDSTEDEEILPWTISAKTELDKSRIQNGVDLSGTNPTSNSSVSLLHESGWNARLAWSSMLGSEGGPLNWSAALGYDYSLTDWLDMTAGVSHTKYFADSINAISNLQNSLSIGLNATLSIVDLGIGYETYFGSDPAKYLSANLSHSFKFGSLSAGLSASLTYMSQTIDAAKLDALAVKMKKKLAAATLLSKSKVTIQGISSYSLNLDVRYDLGSGFNVYLDPSYMVTPKGEVSSKDRQLSWTVGVQYSIEF